MDGLGWKDARTSLLFHLSIFICLITYFSFAFYCLCYSWFSLGKGLTYVDDDELGFNQLWEWKGKVEGVF